MVQEREARARFAELMAPDATIELDLVALTIAQAEYAGLDPAAYIRRLDEMAAALRPRLSPEESPERLVAEVNMFLYGEQAFHGNVADYYDPRNSYLNDVLDRRTGIPITLALVYLELARRLHLPIEGVAMPGHFILRCHGARGELMIDAFHAGAILTEADCAARIRDLYGGSLRFSPSLLRAAGPREIVTRMLGNLKGTYLRRGDIARALRALEWSIAANADRAEDLREKGLLRLRAGDFRGGIHDLEQFLERQPDGILADQTRLQLRRVEQLWNRRN